MKFYFLLWCLIGVSCQSMAQQQCPVIRAGCASSWYPVAFHYPQGEIKASGVAILVAQKAAKQLNINIEFNCSLPWKRATWYLEQGQLDLLVGHYSNATREKNWLVSSAIFDDDVRAIYRRDSMKIQNISDLKNLSGIKLRGGSYGAMIDQYIQGNIPGYTFHEANDKQTLIDFVLKNRADYALRSKHDALELIRVNKAEGMLALSDSLALNSVHMAFSKQSQCASQLKSFNQLIETYRQDGSIEDLLNQSKHDYQLLQQNK